MTIYLYGSVHEVVCTIRKKKSEIDYSTGMESIQHIKGKKLAANWYVQSSSICAKLK